MNQIVHTDEHCEWHADEMACEDAAGDHDGHDHGDCDSEAHFNGDGIRLKVMVLKFTDNFKAQLLET